MTAALLSTSTTGYLTNWGAATALEALLQGPTWLALHSDDPTALASASSEYIGGGYVRQPIAFAASAARAKVSVNAQVFSGLLAGSVGWFAVWTAVSGGHCCYVIQLDVPLMVTQSTDPDAPADGAQVWVPAGDIALAF
jgi:hypothetical protein